MPTGIKSHWEGLTPQVDGVVQVPLVPGLPPGDLHKEGTKFHNQHALMDADAGHCSVYSLT